MTLPQRPAIRKRDAHEDGRMHSIHPSRAAFFSKKLWPNGSSLRVRFIGGNSIQQAFVKKTMMSLYEFINLKFVFLTVPGQSDCRIDFQTGQGSWSYVGTDNRSIPQNAATMNLGWVDKKKPSSEDAGTVLHETLHFIGACHEHQRIGMFKWNKEAVYRDLQGPPNYWTKAQIDENVLQTVDSKQLTMSPVADRHSIMEYVFPAAWTLDGKGAPQNDVLSETDKTYLRLLYPKKPVKKQGDLEDGEEEDDVDDFVDEEAVEDEEIATEEGEEDKGNNPKTEEKGRCGCTCFIPCMK